MTEPHPSPPGFWRTVWLLLGVAAKRASRRRERRRRLVLNRGGSSGAAAWGGFGTALVVAVMVGLHVGTGLLVSQSVLAGERAAIERHGGILVEWWFAREVRLAEQDGAHAPYPELFVDRRLAPHYRTEARRLVRNFGGSEQAVARRLRQAVLQQRTADFIELDTAFPDFRGPAWAATFPPAIACAALLAWFLMLVFQGEGVVLDPQRRRHPIWEWLLSHPVPASAVFCAEMIMPMAANPIFYGAPLVPGILYGKVYGAPLGMLAAVLIGIPIALAASCLGKAIEISAMLRAAPRTRGPIIGVMTALGSVVMWALGLALLNSPPFAAMLAERLRLSDGFGWHWLGLPLGLRPDGTFSFRDGLLICWTAVLVVIAGSIGLARWSAGRGLGGRIDSTVVASRTRAGARTWFGKDPLYRKELLWLTRERSAVVQAVLVPVGLAALQVLNMQGLLVGSGLGWNYLCALAILFGTSFLSVVGPRSLASEGPALWIAMSWPLGLEAVLAAKARLWAGISTGLVAIILAYAAYRSPAESWRVLLVGVAWFAFARSMARKSVTLATVTDPSGEPQRVPAGRRWAAQLGLLAFSVGVLDQNWQLVVLGVGYSMMTAVAMWENLRFRLPFVYDPWSERLPQAPTLMHAMVALSLLIEVRAAFMAFMLPIVGAEAMALPAAILNAVFSAAVMIGVAHFLSRRGVRQPEIWTWRDHDHRDGITRWTAGLRRPGRKQLVISLLAGIGVGLALGFAARGYRMMLPQLPWVAQFVEGSPQQLQSIPHAGISLFITAVLVAPIGEEYLFRGLLFRSLDRVWGGWRAVAGSAAFFAMYHPALAWLPVGILGAANAVLFKCTGRLAPTVLTHCVYNAVVLANLFR